MSYAQTNRLTQGTRSNYYNDYTRNEMKWNPILLFAAQIKNARVRTLPIILWYQQFTQSKNIKENPKKPSRNIETAANAKPRL